nr:reverse transcriptase domain-containing protein [Tanacetum cinerariifolium]
MSSPDQSTSNNEDAFSSNIADYISTIPDYSPASSGKTYSNASNNSIGKIPLEYSPFYIMKDIQAFYAKELPIPPPVILPPSLVLSQSPISDSQDFFPFEEISPKDTETSVSPSSSVGSSSLSRLTISPLDYPFDESIFTKLDNSLWIIPRPLGEEPVPEEPNKRFQELALLCPNMVPNSEKLIKVFIGGLPRSVKGNVTASNPQTLEEVITITQRLMEQVIKQQAAQEADDHKRKFEDRRNTTGKDCA